MSSTRDYSANVVRVLHPTTNNKNWEEQRQYESKTTRNNYLDSSDNQLSSTNFIRQAQTNYSQRSNYSTKSNREYNIDDGLLQASSISPQRNQHQQKIITTKTSNYSTTPGSNTTGYNSVGNVDYLDELLDDLKNERTHSTITNDINEYTTSPVYKYNSSSNIPGGGNVTTHIHHHKYPENIYNTSTRTSKSISSGNLIEHNPHTGTTIKRTEKIEVLPQGGSTIQRSKHVEVLNSKSLETVPLLPHSNTSASETTVKRDVVIQNSGLPSDLEAIKLDPTLGEDLLPLPGTKVTTTVRTYTYEVPSVVTRTNVLYHDDIRNPPSTTSTINKNYSENITNIHDNYSTTTTTDKRILNGNLPSPNGSSPVPHIHEPDSGPGPKRTYYYKHEVHNTKNTINQPPLPQPPQPYINEYHITKNTTNTTTNRYPPNDMGTPSPQYARPVSPESISPIPPPTVSHHTYITRTTTNDYTDGPKPRDITPYDGPGGRPPYHDNTPSPHSPGFVVSPGSHGPHGPHGPITQTYIRTHEKTTTMPFPVNGEPYPNDVPNGHVQPPKKLDDLMASFDRNGDGPDTDDIRRKREVDTSIANTDNKVRVPSRNQAGPPVFYPPNSELTLRKKEEGGGAWRAQGGYAAGAAGSEYYAESSSKSKSKSGAAVVPVCLPLCCAMPCVLM